MDDRVAGALSLPDDWPAHPDLSLALNRMGSFDWDLDTGLMHMDRAALDVFDLTADEYDDRRPRWRRGCRRTRPSVWTGWSRTP